MNEKKVVSMILQTKFVKPIQDVTLIWFETVPSCKADVDDRQNILSCLKADLMTFKLNDEANTAYSTEMEVNDTKVQKKKRGRPPIQYKSEKDLNAESESSDGMSSNDSISSVSSTRSKRAAAQAAGHKLAQVQSFIKAKKLRRPTDYSVKLVKHDNTISSPPAKSRRTARQQSAGSIVEEIQNNIEKKITNGISINNIENINCTKNCSVAIRKLEEQEIDDILLGKDDTKAFTNNAEDAFHNISGHFSKNTANFYQKNSFEILQLEKNPNNLNETHTVIEDHQKNKLDHKKDKDSGISSNEEEIHKLEGGNAPVAQSSPIFHPSCSPVCELNNEGNKSSGTTTLNATFVKNNDVHEIKNDAEVSENKAKQNKQFNNDNHVSSSNSSPGVTSNNNDNINAEQENYLGENKTVCEPDSESRSIRSRTKVIKKRENVQSVDSGGRVEIVSKFDKDIDEETLQNKSPERNVRSRAKTIQINVKENSTKENISNNFEFNPKVEIDTVKKQDEVLSLDSSKLCSSSKRDLVKKRVEDFEKMKCGVDENLDERTTRVTRNAVKNKNVVLATENQYIKQSRNVPCKFTSSSKLQLSEKVRLTPLATCNRMTPGSASKTIAAIKGSNLISRQNKNENTSAILVQKQVTDEVERKRREEERIRRKAKEEDAKKKKEKTLKATAEETRRKREEKLQKVAAAREAADREKAILTAKAEKEKEEKMRQIAAEREKLKEEQQKKKLLMQQKTLEHEERRKQDEAARLAKLKEQEEEHKRIIAIKEREQEMALKQQKTTENRFVEVDKTKHQGPKLAKLPGLNGKFKQDGVAVTENSKAAKQEVQSYDITPARDERPLLKPKTEDDYGIDDAHSEDSSDDESRPKKVIPLWAQSKNRDRLLLINNLLPKEIFGLFMQADPCPDVTKMFAGNPGMKRTRTSSAVWRTPPNYSHFVNK